VATLVADPARVRGAEHVADDPRPPRRLAVLASGSGSNLQALLDATAADPAFGGAVAVVGSDRPGCLAVERARRAGIPVVATPLDEHPDRPAWEDCLAEGLSRHRPDLVVLAGFMRVLSGRFLARWPGRIVNVHPALLPAFPGAHGVRDALAHGVKVTGSTVHLVDETVDRGPIVAQRCVEVRDDDTEATLHQRIKAVEHELLPAVVKLLCHGRVELEDRRTRIRPAQRAAARTPLDPVAQGTP
jgi:phosphoribosylglycinamide formyltransferase-1